MIGTSESKRSSASNNGASVKSKLLLLHEQLVTLTEEVNEHRDEVEFLREEKERLEAEHDVQAKQVKDDLINEA